MSSFNIPIRLSLAANTPFRIRFAMKLLRGHLANRTMEPGECAPAYESTDCLRVIVDEGGQELTGTNNQNLEWCCIGCMSISGHRGGEGVKYLRTRNKILKGFVRSGDSIP